MEYENTGTVYAPTFHNKYLR